MVSNEAVSGELKNACNSSVSDNKQELLQIEIKAEQLLQEILSGKSDRSKLQPPPPVVVKQEPAVHFNQHAPPPSTPSPHASTSSSAGASAYYQLPANPVYHQQAHFQHPLIHNQLPFQPQPVHYGAYQLNPISLSSAAPNILYHHLPPQAATTSSNFYARHPPPTVQFSQQPQFYQRPPPPPVLAYPGNLIYQQGPQLAAIQTTSPYIMGQPLAYNQFAIGASNASSAQFNAKRKFAEMSNNKSYNQNRSYSNNYNRYHKSTSGISSASSKHAVSDENSNSSKSHSQPSLNLSGSSSGSSSLGAVGKQKSREKSQDNDDEDENDEDEDEEEEDEDDEIVDDDDDDDEDDEDDETDANLMRERELNELKCKSVAEKMNVFVNYYQQLRCAYADRVHSLECTDSLRMQFTALGKFLAEYGQVLVDLERMVCEHEREHRCKNNHRKTKKFFNKSKAFIRYECSKRLQANIFEYRRLINSQDRYAGMYDLVDMNNYLTGLLPDIGVSIRRYINKCERQRKQELEDEETEAAGGGGVDSYDANWHSNENSRESTSEEATNKQRREYESFSTGIDSLNRYLLDRVDKEESLDELVKERIVKWINKRQSKYILIFSEVDKLLNQHKDGECHAKFHSYLQFNLGKLVTVCDSYHQKLKELLYSTTIRRKKKRKKVKLLPEAMADVFIEINDLKRTLEHTKTLIKKCTEMKNAAAASAVIASASSSSATTIAQ